MGVCISHEETVHKSANHAIEKQIMEDKQKKVIKLLLLGTGESGKSTILKQMRILHDSTFPMGEMDYRRSMVYTNILDGMCALVNAVLGATLSFSNPEMEAYARHVIEAAEHSNGAPIAEPFDRKMYTALNYLWADPRIKELFKRKRHQVHVQDSLQHFMNSLDRIVQPGYEPTMQDLLYTRIPTSGVIEVNFKLRNFTVRVFDVGGQRSQRRKWIHCFDDVNSLIFVTSLSEYNQNLREDESQNRMRESLVLFENTVNSTWFVRSSIILFLNKRDLLEEQLGMYPISMAFPDYTGPDEYAPALDYIKQRFQKKVLPAANRQLYTFETCATDTNQVKKIIDSVMDLTIQFALSRIGLT